MFDNKGEPIFTFTPEQWLVMRKYRENCKLRIGVWPPNHVYIGGKEVAITYVEQFIRDEEEYQEQLEREKDRRIEVEWAFH